MEDCDERSVLARNGDFNTTVLVRNSKEGKLIQIPGRERNWKACLDARGNFRAPFSLMVFVDVQPRPMANCISEPLGCRAWTDPRRSLHYTIPYDKLQLRSSGSAASPILTGGT